MKASTACGCSLSLGVSLVDKQEGLIDERVGKLLDTSQISVCLATVFWSGLSWKQFCLQNMVYV